MADKIKILCYGDSNTWGFDPQNGTRLPAGIRWPGVLGKSLGQDYIIIEDGLNGRTLGEYYPPGDPLNGSEHLFSCLKAYAAIDTLIIYLGINDLFCDRRISAQAMANTLAGVMENLFQSHTRLQTIIMPPLPINTNNEYASLYESEIKKATALSKEYKGVAEKYGCLFVNPADIIAASQIDGVHIDAENHVKLGDYLGSYIRENLS